MKTAYNGQYWFLDPNGGVAIGSLNYQANLAPSLASAMVVITNGNNQNFDFSFATLPEGYYRIDTVVLVEMADATWRELPFKFSMLWSGGVLVPQGVPTVLTGAWDSSGLTGTISVVASNTLRVNVANGSGQDTLANGGVYIQFGRRIS